MAAYLTNDVVYRLTDAVLSGGLATTDGREELLAGINVGYVASLPDRGNALDQIRSDLVEMNRVPYLLGGEVPLQIWLENAVQRLRRTVRPEQLEFQDALDQVAAKGQNLMAGARGIEARTRTDRLERIVHQDDLLPYGWLQGALSVGTAVARLTVPRHVRGVEQQHPGSPAPIREMGTGWLIGAQHVITNHHVVNARSAGEPNAAEDDLRLQVEKTTIQFDFDTANAEGTTIVGASLEAWVPRDRVPTLDFAVLRLPAPSSRLSLTLAPNSVQEFVNGVGPVNIVQHAGGAAKMLGVRNNLVSTVDQFSLSYYTDTMRGSSGSPVCNDRWQVVALHRAWEFVNADLVFQGKETAWRNLGVRIDRIVEYLQQHHSQVWSAIAARVV